MIAAIHFSAKPIQGAQIIKRLQSNGVLRRSVGEFLCRVSVLSILSLGAAISLGAQQASTYKRSCASPGSSASSHLVSAPSDHSSTPGAIHGVVEAKDGSVYEGAHVTLEQVGSSTTEVQSTDESGQFAFTGVPAGCFKLTVSADGFESATVSGTLAAGETYDAHSISLALNSAVSSVEVRASRHTVAQDQLRLEEQQRVLGIVPNFFVAYAHDAAPLSPGQKFHLSWRSSIDPLTIFSSVLTAGIEQHNNDFKEYGQGTAGFAKRFGASYGDNLIGTFIGSAMMPSLLHQDPRYFYRGTGSVRSRAFYAIASSVICKSDRGRWQPNYSNFIGDLAAAGISNLYYPPSERGSAGLVFQNIAIGKATAAAQNILQEFVIPHFTSHKHMLP